MRKIRFLISIFFVLIIFTSCNFRNYENIIFNKTTEDYGDTGGLSLPVDINNTEIEIIIVSDAEELSDSLIIKELSKRTGLNIKIINIASSEALRHTQLLLSTNDLPDIIKTTLDKEEINNLGEKGTFVSINKYLNELPNFRRIFIEDEDYNSVMNRYAASDNNLYFYPKFEYQKEVSHGFLYRKDIFDKNNLSMWTNKEEFYNTLKALKEIYPDSTPYVSKSEKNIFSEWSLSFGIDFPGIFYDYEKDRWIYSGCDMRFKEMLDFIKKLYSEDLVDRTFLTTSSYLWDWKITGDNGFVTYGELSEMDTLYEKTKATYPEFNLSYANPPGSHFRVKKNGNFGIGPNVTNNKNSLLSLKLLDYLASPSGIELSTLGMVNQTYEYNNNEVIYSGFNKEKYSSIKELEEKFGLFVSDLYLSVDKRSPYLKYSTKEAEAINVIEDKDGFLEEYPSVKLTDSERIKADEIESLLNSKALEYANNFILGLEDKEFNEWILEAEKIGVRDLEELYNKK